MVIIRFPDVLVTPCAKVALISKIHGAYTIGVPQQQQSVVLSFKEGNWPVAIGQSTKGEKVKKKWTPQKWLHFVVEVVCITLKYREEPRKVLSTPSRQ